MRIKPNAPINVTGPAVTTAATATATGGTSRIEADVAAVLRSGGTAPRSSSQATSPRANRGHWQQGPKPRSVPRPRPRPKPGSTR